VPGTVEAIFLTPSAGTPPESVETAAAVAGRGLRGDRYFRGVGGGEFYAPDKEGQDLTLIESEALAALAADSGIELDAAAARRNVLTRGIGLNDLVGRRFRVGAVECLGRRLAEPCSHLAGLTEPGVLRALVNRGGLRADVLADGVIAVGDPVEPL
jgi:MOSC domain-containing protein YiiM